MTLTIPLEDTIVALHQLHSPLLDLVLLLIFNYQLEHIFILDRTLFTQALANVPHLFLGGLSGMVDKHLSKCFIPKNPSLRLLELFQTTAIIAHGDFPKLVALMLGACKLLAMAKDNGGFHILP